MAKCINSFSLSASTMALASSSSRTTRLASCAAFLIGAGANTSLQMTALLTADEGEAAMMRAGSVQSRYRPPIAATVRACSPWLGCTAGSDNSISAYWGSLPFSSSFLNVSSRPYTETFFTATAGGSRPQKPPRCVWARAARARPRRGNPASSFASGERCTISSSICGRPKWCWNSLGYSKAQSGGGAAGGLGAFALHLQPAVHG